MSKTTVYFDGQRALIQKYLSEAKKSIIVAMAYFTDGSMFDVLVKKAHEGVIVKLIIRDDETNIMTGINYKMLNTLNGEFSYDKSIHHKFCVIDSMTVLTGSYDWTYDAWNNHEDIVVIEDDNTIASFYLTKFKTIKDPNRQKRFLQEWALKRSERRASRTVVLNDQTENNNAKTESSLSTNSTSIIQRQYTDLLYNDNHDSIASTVKSIIRPLQEFGFAGSSVVSEAMGAFAILIGQRAQAAIAAGATRENYLLDTGLDIYYDMYEKCFVSNTDKYKLDLPLFVFTAMYMESSVKRASIKVADTSLLTELFECIYNVCKQSFPTQIQFNSAESIEVMNKFSRYLQRKYPS